MKQKHILKFTIYWKSGEIEIIYGPSFHEALIQEGYPLTCIPEIDHIEEE